MVTVRGFASAITRSCVSDCDALSVTFIVNWWGPTAAFGVPVIAPVVGFRLRPDGKPPETIDHEYGGDPPDTESVWLYDIPFVASVRLVVVIGSSPTIA